MEITKKIVILGQFGVGKTSITRRYLLDIFEKDYIPTLGVQIKKKVIELPSGNLLSMIVWDLEGFSSVAGTRASYLLGSNGFIYVFDITRPFTYERLDEEIKFIKEKYPQVVFKVVGNKLDQKDPFEIQAYFDQKNIKIDAFVSAKTGQGIHELFTDLANNFET